MERRVGTIGHIGMGRNRGLGLGMAAVMAAAVIGATTNPAVAQAVDADMKRLFKSNLKVRKRNYPVREQVRAFTALPKIDIKAIDILQFEAALRGLKQSTSMTMHAIMEVYRNEPSVEEINDLKGWSNQAVAQFIHGAYAIIDSDLQDLKDHVKDDPRQQNNLNSLRSVREEIYRRMNGGLITVLSAPEPREGQTMSPEAITAIKDFEGMHRRITNTVWKIEQLTKTRKV